MALRRITRWYERLCKYDFEVTYRPGSQNPVADCLSRLPLGDDNPYEPKEEDKLIASIRTLEEEAALSRGEIKKATSEDEELKSVMKFVKHGWPKNNKIPTQMMPYKQIQNELFIVDGCLLRTEDRFIIPKSLIQRVIKLAHETHPGMTRTKQRIREYYWWPQLNKTVETLIQNCTPCQNSDKSSKPIKEAIQPVVYPMRQMGKVSIDICGPFLKAPVGKKYLTIMMDYYSRWPEMLKSEKMPTSAMIITWLKTVFGRFGNPEDLVSDNGSQFTSNEFESFLRNRDIKHSKAVPYNPPANGLIERFNREVKALLQAGRYSSQSYEDRLNNILILARTSINRGTQQRPDVLFLGRKIRTNLSAPAFESEDAEADKRREEYQESYRKDVSQNMFKVGDYAKFRKMEGVFKGCPRWSLPYKIMEKIGPATFKLSCGIKINARRLRRSHGPPDECFPVLPEQRPEIAPTERHPRSPVRQIPRRSARTRRSPQRYGEWETNKHP